MRWNWLLVCNNHFCLSIPRLFRRRPISKRWSDSQSTLRRRIKLSGASLLWSESTYRSIANRLAFDPFVYYFSMFSFDFIYSTLLFVFQFAYFRGSVHYNQNDVPALWPWYIRRFVCNSAIDPLLALQLNNRMSLLYLRKHLGNLSNKLNQREKQTLKKETFSNGDRTSGGWGTCKIHGATCGCNLRGNSLVKWPLWRFTLLVDSIHEMLGI